MTTVKTQPCEESCPKCGAKDAYHHYMEKGRVSLCNMFESKPPLNTRHVETVDLRCRVIEECILHHCKCCGWEWTTDTLDKPE